MGLQWQWEAGEEGEESPGYKEAIVLYELSSPFSGGRKQLCDLCGIVWHIC